MTSFTRFIAGTTALGLAASTAAAQYNPYPSQQGYDYPTYPGQPYPQQYPPQQTYPGYPQGYGQGYTGNPVTDIIDQLLGNRYNVTDRQAVRQCARAATAQAQSQYGYNQNQAYAQGDLSFRCNVDYRGAVTGLRVRPANYR